MRSYYDLMKISETQGDDGSIYFDSFTLPTNDFVFSSIPVEYTLTQTDILRPDIFISNYYGSSDLYDIVIDINCIEDIKTMNPGDIIYLPSRVDLENFYSKNLR